MKDETIIRTSKIGQRLDAIVKSEQASYLVFNGKKIPVVSKITIGRESDNDVVIDNQLASRHHSLIQKIKDEYFIKDLESTNGTLLNGEAIPVGQYVKLQANDVITVGKANLIIK